MKKILFGILFLIPFLGVAQQWDRIEIDNIVTFNFPVDQFEEEIPLGTSKFAVVDNVVYGYSVKNFSNQVVRSQKHAENMYNNMLESYMLTLDSAKVIKIDFGTLDGLYSSEVELEGISEGSVAKIKFAVVYVDKTLITFEASTVIGTFEQFDEMLNSVEFNSKLTPSAQYGKPSKQKANSAFEIGQAVGRLVGILIVIVLSIVFLRRRIKRNKTKTIDF